MRKLAKLSGFGALLVLFGAGMAAAEADRLETGVVAGGVAEVAAQVDRLLAEELFDPAQAELAARTGDVVYLRRVYLDLVGRLPTPGEITAFALDPASDKRAALVERLLADGDYGRNWGRYWRDVIFYRRAEDRAMLGAAAAENYLVEALNANRSWGEIVAEFITATGNVQESGTTAILFAQSGETEDIAAEVSRIFLGVQIQCAQCHDHPTDRWTREQFHEFAAFFPRVALRPVIVDGRQRGFEIASRDFAPQFRRPAPANPRAGQTEHAMPDLQDPTARGTVMTPVFFATDDRLATGTRDLERREALAAWMTSPRNEWFAKALVNRLWAELVGEGFYEPIDDIGPDREPTAPRTLELLASEFAAHNYDLKWLYRTILATEAYQRESRSRRLPDAMPMTANVPQRLRSDQLYTVLETLTGGDNSTPFGRGNFAGGRAAFGSPRNQFATTFGYDPSNLRTEVSGSISQALLLMNGGQYAQGLSARNPRGVVGRVLATCDDNTDAVEELYLRVLAREPEAHELEVCLEHIDQAPSRDEGLEDLAWSLVNSAEFLHRY